MQFISVCVLKQSFQPSSCCFAIAAFPSTTDCCVTTPCYLALLLHFWLGQTRQSGPAAPVLWGEVVSVIYSTNMQRMANLASISLTSPF